MTLNNLPQLILNNEELKILNTIGEGGMGLTLGLTYKNNPTNYPLLVCKLYKKFPEWIEKNLKNYLKMYEAGFSPKLLGIQKTENEYYNVCHINKKKKKRCNFDKHIFYYEIAGICTLTQFISLSSLVNYDNYQLIIKYFKITIEKALLLSTKLNIVHPDLHASNIMIFNEHTLYLFNKFILYDKIKDTKEFDKKSKYFTKLIINCLLNKNSISGNTNKDLIKNTKNIKLSYDNKPDIKIIDCDRVRNINEIMITFASKYNHDDKKVNEIFELIYFSLMYLNVLKFLLHTLKFLNIIYLKNKNDNIQKLIEFCNNSLNQYCKEMYSKSKIYKSIKDETLQFTLFNSILYGIFFAQNQEEFDNVFNYLKNKKYVDFYNNEIKDKNKNKIDIYNMTYSEIVKIYK